MAKKKKFLTKKKIAGVGLLAAAFFFIRGGDEWFKFLPESIQAYIEVKEETTEDNTKKEQDNTNKEKPNVSVEDNKTDTQNASKEEQSKEVSLRMRFIENILYVGNWSSPSKDELLEVVKKIRTKYPNKEIRIKYFKDGSDPFEVAHSAQKVLEKEGFKITVHDNNEEQE